MKHQACALKVCWGKGMAARWQMRKSRRKLPHYTVFPLVELYLQEMNIKKKGTENWKERVSTLLVIILISSNIIIKRWILSFDLSDMSNRKKPVETVNNNSAVLTYKPLVVCLFWCSLPRNLGVSAFSTTSAELCRDFSSGFDSI